MRIPFIAGNWKMNSLRADGLALDRDLLAWLETARPGVEMLICPPATLLSDIAAIADNRPLRVGAQDCHYRAAGAHTGDLSAAMLADAGASHVILGHSERRSRGEDSAMVAAKASAALPAGLCPLICIGETLAEREAGMATAVVAGQLRDSLPPGLDADRVIIAYEPVWAIGTGLSADTDTVAGMHALIKTELAALLPGGGDVRVLYGGSVTPANATTILRLPGVDGVLVGGASLKAADFKAIALCGVGGA